MSVTYTLPTFTHISAVDADPVMRRHDAAAALNISYERLVKLIGAGLIPEPIPTLTIQSLAGRPFLAAHGGELTVLRTGASPPTHIGDASAKATMLAADPSTPYPSTAVTRGETD